MAGKLRLPAREFALGRKRGKGQQRQLDAAVAALQGRYGPWALVKGKSIGAAGGAAPVPHISTGFRDLDRALGIGGLPKGRICELLGPATSGKTTLALKFLAQAQAGGAQVAYVDQARYFDPDYAHRCGLDLSRLWVGTPRDLREALALTEALARSGGLSALVFDVVDSVWTDPAQVPHLAAAIGRLPLALGRSGAALLVLHELASSSPALSALTHGATVRLRLSRERWIHRQGDIRGYEAQVEILKNRLGPSGRTATIAIEFNGTVHGEGL